MEVAKPFVILATVGAILALAAFLWTMVQDQRPPGFVGKTVYSLILVLVAGLLVREVFNVWEPRRTGIGALQVSAGGDADTVRAEAIRAMIVQRYDRINATFKRENERRAALLEQDSRRQGQEAAPLPFSDASLGFSSDQLDQLELTVQGVNFGQILAGLRRRVAPPNEITGHIVQPGDDREMSAVIRWPGAPQFDTLPNESNRLMTFEDISRDGDLADEVACSLIWAQVVPQADKKVSNMRRGQYCRWVRGFLLWVAASERRAANLKPLPGQDEAIDKTLDDLRLLISQEVDFPEVYLLMANLIALKVSPPQEEQREAEEARFIYARLDAGDSLEDAVAGLREVRVAVASAAIRPTTGESASIAAERPIILVENGAAQYAPESGLGEALRASEESVAVVAAATGFLEVGGASQQSWGTAFVVGPDVVAGPSYLVQTMDAPKGPLGELSFSTDDAGPDGEGRRLSVTEVIASDDVRQVALFRVPGLADLGIAPVPLAEELPETLIGDPVAIIGYPASDARRTPPAVLKEVLDPEMHKRLMLGRTIETEREGQIGHDAFTTGGVGGAPILHLTTREVIGIHLGGEWSATGTEKRNFAQPISKAFLDGLVDGATE